MTLAALIGGLALIRGQHVQAQDTDTCIDPAPVGETPGTSGCSCRADVECPGGLGGTYGNVYGGSGNSAQVFVSANFGPGSGYVRGFVRCINAPIPTTYVRSYTSSITSGNATVSTCGVSGFYREAVGCEANRSACP